MFVRFVTHRVSLSVLSGLLLAASFPGLDWGWLAFVALVPLLAAVRGASWPQGFWRGMIAGGVFFTLTYSWITEFTGRKLGALGWASGEALALIQAFAVAFFGLGASLLQRADSRVPAALRLAGIASLWVVCEWGRQLGSLGMGWGDLGYTQWHNSWLIRVAPLAGIWGIAWLIALVNAAAASGNRRWVVGSVVAGLAVCAVAAPLGSASVRPSGPGFKAAALQTNITQNVDWGRMRPESGEYYARNLATIDAMCGEAQARGARLAALSETAAPGYPRLDWPLRKALQRSASAHGLALVAGAHDVDTLSGEDQNAAMLFQPGDTFSSRQQTYAKQQLVPFGEFVPYDDVFPWLKAMHVLDADDRPGRADQPDLAAGAPVGKIGTAICYESSYPRFLRQQTRAGADVLTVITYDTWYGESAAARQHMAMSALAAAECGRSVVHCATTGISAVFAPDGRELGEAGLFKRETLVNTVTPMRGETVFVRFGDWMVWVSAAVLTTVAAFGVAGRTRQDEKNESATTGSEARREPAAGAAR